MDVLKPIIEHLIEYEKTLEMERKIYIGDLEQNGPKVFIKDGETFVSLLRDGKSKHYNFENQLIYIVRRNDFALKTWGINPDVDGWGYWIYVEAKTPYVIPLSKDEATILRLRLREANERSLSSCNLTEEYINQLKTAMRHSDGAYWSENTGT
jgi:hypothetical protein